MPLFENKVLLITGGTGSFGHAVLDRFLTTDIREIRILSRDEKKQDDMRHAYQLSCPACAEKIKFYIGDVRDYRSIAPAFRGVDYVFHAAALKQVPSCEFFPMEAVKTNVIGSNNVIDACVENRVKKAIFLSTDKAAYPINAMGMSKALMEKNVVARSKQIRRGEAGLRRSAAGLCRRDRRGGADLPFPQCIRQMVPPELQFRRGDVLSQLRSRPADYGQ